MEVNVVSLRMVRDHSIIVPGVISEPAEVVRLWRRLHPLDPDREELWVVCLDGQMQPTTISMVSRGSLDGALATPREIFKTAILANAKCVILIHNHPSGDPQPSEEDRWITEVVWDAGEILGIPLRDHVIVAEGRHYSYAVEEGWGSVGYVPPAYDTKRQRVASTKPV